MKKGIQIHTYVEGGNIMLSPDVKQRFWGLIKSKFEGERITIRVKKRTNDRSLDQNAYYWGVVIKMVHEAARELGNNMTADQIHEDMKENFGEREQVISPVTGQIKQIIKSTSNYSTNEFSDYIEKIKAFASEFFGIYIPDPNEATPVYE